MIPYARQSIDEDDVAAVNAVLRSDFLTQGPTIERFEEAVARLCGATHAVAVSNATSALHLACRALDVANGDLVWTSPNSFVASANCARYCGADIDFVDIDEHTYNMGIPQLERKLASADRLPKVVVAVDFAGQPAAWRELSRLRDRYGFRLIEDASHAIGATYEGHRIGDGRYSDITVFSFHPVKIVTTGEGGMLVTADSAIAERLRLLRSHGITRDPSCMGSIDPEPWEYEQVDLGYNYRLTDIAAALGIAQMARVDEFLSRRREIARRYDDELAGLPLVLPFQDPQGVSAYHLYPIRVKAHGPFTRREVHDGLKERGIATNVHYIPIHTQPYYRQLGFRRGDFPNAERYYDEALSLPMFASLTRDDQTRVIRALHEIFQGQHA